MDPEDLSVVVALGEGKAVALGRAVVAAHTEQDLVDRVVGDLRVGVGVQQPVGILRLNNHFAFLLQRVRPEVRRCPYLTVPSDTPGTDSVTSRGTWHCPRRMLIIRRASTSLRGALTEAQPRYVSWLNTTLSSSGMGLMGLPSDEDSSAAKTSEGSTIFRGFASTLLSSSFKKNTTMEVKDSILGLKP